jgi:hypothetical protein
MITWIVTAKWHWVVGIATPMPVSYTVLIQKFKHNSLGIQIPSPPSTLRSFQKSMLKLGSQKYKTARSGGL